MYMHLFLSLSMLQVTVTVLCIVLMGLTMATMLVNKTLAILWGDKHGRSMQTLKL